MNFLQSILLGILQGVAEFLPISSSGHLVLARHLMHIDEISMLYDILLHVATLAAVVIVFRKRIMAIISSLIKAIQKKNNEQDKENLKLFYLVIIATAATLVIGLIVKKFLDVYPLNYKAVASLSIVTGIILIASKFFKGKKEYHELNTKHGLITGIAQGLGVFPGISRSGITITASIGAGITREKAGEFSFLISIPAILGALILDIKDLEIINVEPIVIAAGMISSFIVGLVSLVLLLKIIKSGKFHYFSFYLIPMGLTFLLFL